MIFLADFPPPVHGMSNVNDAFCNKLKQCDDIVIIDSSPPVREKYFNTPFWLLAKILMLPILSFRMVFNFLCLGHSTLYRSINGGVGQLFDVVFMAIARVFGVRVFIHHHSFNYIAKKSLLFILLNKVAGKEAVHIVLGVDMMKGLSEFYHIPDSCFRIQSNLAFFDNLSISKEMDVESKGVIKIGHLSNLCEEKGLGIFIEVCRLLDRHGVAFEAFLAGPFVNKKAEDLYLKNKSYIEYLGPVYGEKKNEFYSSLDIFVFPSMYFNEAEPLVLYEAAQKGCYLIGTERGCMSDVLMMLGGAVFVEGDSLADDIANKIRDLLNSEAFGMDEVASRCEFLNVKMRTDREALSKLVNEIIETDQ